MVCIPIMLRVFFFVVSLTYVTTFLVEEHSQSCMQPYQSIENCAQMAGNFRGTFQKKNANYIKKNLNNILRQTRVKRSFFIYIFKINSGTLLHLIKTQYREYLCEFKMITDIKDAIQFFNIQSLLDSMKNLKNVLDITLLFIYHF